MQKYNMEYVINYLNENFPDLILLSTEYKSAKEKLEFVCNKHSEKGVQYKPFEKIIYRNSGCRFCGMEKQRASLRIDTNTIKARCIELNLDYFGRFIKNKESWVKFKCDIHKTKGIQEVAWYHLKTASTGCSYCTGRYKTTNDFVKEMKNINPSVEIVGEYKGSEIPIECMCKICGTRWYPISRSLKNRQGCPICASSKGERRIKNYLTFNNIRHIPQKTFNGCNDIKKLRFDFFIESINTCIEYDGIQHFKPVDFASKGVDWANRQFDINQNRDSIKNSFCKNNNINLIRIPYHDFNNIETILDSALSELFLCKNIS